MLNVNVFSMEPITIVPLVIATMVTFFAVILHSLATVPDPSISHKEEGGTD